MNKNELSDYLLNNLQLFEKTSKIEVKEIGDGNINYVFRVRSESGKSFVVKQFDTLLRSSMRPLSTKRSRLEYESMKWKSEFVPDMIPKLFHYDENLSLIVMEDIGPYSNLRELLIDGKVYSHLAGSISSFLAYTLIPMTDLVLERSEKKDKVGFFLNPELCDISEDLVFTEPYYDYKGRNRITEGNEEFVSRRLYDNEEIKSHVLYLKDRFMNYAQTLLHGDFHTGSIFTSEDGMKVIDHEFAFYGPLGYDCGNIFANIAFPIVRRMVIKEECTSIEDLLISTFDLTLEKLNAVFDEFVKDKFSSNRLFKNSYIKSIISDSIGYMGTELIRRIVGDAKVIDITTISNINCRIKAERIVIDSAIHLIMNRENIESGREIVDVIKKYYGDYK